MSGHRKGGAAILQLVNESWVRMSVPQKRLWETIAIDPAQWIFRPHASPLSTSWVVAVIGTHVIWYDDYYGEMTDGFKLSEHIRFSEIGWGDIGGGSLEAALQSLLHRINGLTYGGPQITPPAPP
jgi:hypothetical protein